MMPRSWFSFVIPGQPLSWNASYRITYQRAKDKYGQPVLSASGDPKRYSSMSKAKGVENWQLKVTQIVRTARPTGFQPKEVIVAYRMFLARNIDADNVLKMVNDALAHAMDMNDRDFLPVVTHKEHGVKEPFLEVRVFDTASWATEIHAR